MLSPLPITVEIKHFHLFCGLGGGALGFQRGHARVGTLQAQMRCVGGIDADPAAVVDFNRSVGVRATYMDLFSREQFEAWHGKAPPAQWVEAGPEDIRKAVIGGGTPDIVFSSPPCKGASGLQNPKRAISAKYQALNGLTLRGISLMLQAFQDDPVPLVILENVPRIQSAGKALLDQIDVLLECAGYAVTHTVHDAGVLGGLAQHRKRFLLVARHKGKVPAFLYEAPQRGVRTVGEVIGPMPMPDCGERIHRMPTIEWQTWMRLALVQAGKDWRSLQDLDIGDDGMVRGLRLLRKDDTSAIGDPRTPNWTSERTGRVSAYQQYGVQPWDQPSHTVTSQAAPGAGPFSVADPRTGTSFPSTYGVREWDDASGTVTAHANASTGAFSVADPRLAGWGGRGKGRVAPWGGEAGTVISASTTGTGAFAVADPRLGCDASDLQKRRFNDVYRVVPWDEASGTVTSATGNSRPNIADPRPSTWTEGRKSWEGGGHYGVNQWDEASGTVTGHGKHDNGRCSVADPRVAPAVHAVAHPSGHKMKRAPLIIALDGTWHRPFTTLELAALQGFDWEFLLGRGLCGQNEADWRERIGNAVPPPAAQAIASTMAETLLMSLAGISTPIGNTSIWVRPIATALSVWQ